MTKEEKEQWDIFMRIWVIPALKNTWGEKKCKELVEALEEWEEQGSVLDKVRAEIDQIEINGHIRDTECFCAGINAVLNVINKYSAESDE